MNDDLIPCTKKSNSADDWSLALTAHWPPPLLMFDSRRLHGGARLHGGCVRAGFDHRGHRAGGRAVCLQGPPQRPRHAVQDLTDIGIQRYRLSKALLPGANNVLFYFFTSIRCIHSCVNLDA